MTQTSNLLNPEYLQQSSILTSEISTQELLGCADAMRASNKSNSEDEKYAPTCHNEIKIENFDCGSSKSSEPPINLKRFQKSRNVPLEPTNNQINDAPKRSTNHFDSTDVFNAAYLNQTDFAKTFDESDLLESI